MKKYILESQEKERIKKLYELKGLIFEQPWGEVARKVTNFLGKNEDDIATLLKTSEKTLATTIDDIVSSAIKSKNITYLDDLEAKLMHFYNRSNQQSNVAVAQQQSKTFLDGYAKSKGNQKWGEIRTSVSGGAPKPNPVQPTGAATSAVTNKLAGKRISNRSFGPEYIDFTQMSTVKNMDELNKVIAKALKTGDFNIVPRGGFDKLGIKATDFGGGGFRQFLKDQIYNKGATINEVIPETGRWSINFV